MPSSRTPFAAALIALALAAPAAQAKPGAPENWRSVSVADTEAQALASHGKSAPVKHAARADTADADFDWGTAAIGAGGAITVAMLASLGIGSINGRNRTRTAR